MKKSYIALPVLLLSLLAGCSQNSQASSRQSTQSSPIDSSFVPVGDPQPLNKTISDCVSKGYSLSFDVEGGVFNSYKGNVSFKADYYSDSFNFQSDVTSIYLDNFGYGTKHGEVEEDNLLFKYEVTNNSISSATYLRDQSKSLSDYAKGLASLEKDYYQEVYSKSNNHYICDDSNTVNLFITLQQQFLNSSNSNYSKTLSAAIEDYGDNSYIEFEVLDSLTFKASLNFVYEDSDTKEESIEGSLIYTFKMDHSTLTDPMVSEYLANNTPSTPAINETLSKFYELTKGYNYTQDLGYSAGQSLGTFYCTQNYCYYDLTQKGREVYKMDNNYGYINKNGGVYLFTVTDNIVEIGSQMFKKNTPYTYWYEFRDNLYSSLKTLESDFYTFEELTSTYSSYSDVEGKEIGSYATSCVDYASDLFETALSTGTRTAKGLMLNIDYDSSNTANTTMMFGLIYDYTGETYNVSGVLYTNSLYSNFGSTSVSMLEAQLA